MFMHDQMPRIKFIKTTKKSDQSIHGRSWEKRPTAAECLCLSKFLVSDFLIIIWCYKS